MARNPHINEKVYSLGSDRKLSMQDLLDYFEQQGKMRVSDLHLKIGAPPTYRVDGHLQKMKGPVLDEVTMKGLIHGLLSDVELARFEQDRSVDSSCTAENIQFRLNCFYDNDGPAVALRALHAEVPTVEELGFPNNVWRDILEKKQGLVLVTGITGAGKSTTIASLIDRIAQERPCRIVTLEDPIEYRLKSKAGLISQREVGRDVPSFERGLRDCLREDPDVIFVGEMRDRESTSWTLTAAETGHLVFSTLHTRDTRGTISRIIDLYPPSRQDEISSQLSLSLSHIISQKLIGRKDGEGRVVAMEILNNSYALSNLIRLGKVEQVYSQLQTRTKDIPAERMTTLERSLARLVKSGKVAVMEAEKWANNANAFLEEMQKS